MFSLDVMQQQEEKVLEENTVNIPQCSDPSVSEHSEKGVQPVINGYHDVGVGYALV